MKRFTKTKKVLLTLGIIFTFSILLSTNFSHYQSKSYGYLESYNEQKLERSGYWEMVYIEIDDNHPEKNWSITASNEDWCSGIGTIGDPYIIENVTINGFGSDDCILIKDSNVYFKIHNCTVFNSGSLSQDAGIKLENTNNGQLINNTCSNNNYYGIYLTDCDNNIVSGNSVNGNDEIGIRISLDSNYNNITGNIVNTNHNGIVIYGMNNMVSGNIAKYNNYAGIQISNNNNTISENNVNNNWGVGIESSGDNNIISGNTVSYTNQHGMRLTGCDNNIISGNTVSYNNYAGMDLTGCDNNIISGNTVNTNGREGISFSGSYDNVISENTINYNSRGISFFNSRNNAISGNNISYNEGSGIRLLACNYNTISGNNASYNEADGISLSDSDYNDILGNDATNNTSNGIDLSRSNYNTVSGNNLIGNDKCIREYECEGNIFENNDCDVVEDDKKPAIPGYNLFFLFGILSVVAIIISKKIRDL